MHELDFGGKVRARRRLLKIPQVAIQKIASGDLLHQTDAPSNATQPQSSGSHTTDKALPSKEAPLKRLQELTSKQRTRGDAVIKDLLRGYEAKLEKI